MAEEAIGIKNTKLLVIAAICAIVALVAHNLHINYIRGRERGERKELLRVERDLGQGDVIEKGDLTVEIVPVRPEHEKFLGRALNAGQLHVAIGKRVTEAVQKGDYLKWGQVRGLGGKSSRANIQRFFG